MRLIKMLGLAAFGVLAAMAFLGVGTASAVVHDRYGLCIKEELVLCEEKNLIPVGSGHLLGKAENPTLSGTLTETCETGHVKGLITGELDEKVELKGKIDEASFTGCKPCTTVTVEGLPYLALLKMLEQVGTELLKWPWSLIVLKPKATLSKCVLGAGTCIFGAEEIKAVVEHDETGTTINTNSAPLEFKGGTLGEGFCGKVGTWNAKYKLKWVLLPSGPEDPVFPTLLGKE